MDRVIKIALDEVGYLEKAKKYWQECGSGCLYNKTEFAGTDNYTKYGYEMHKLYPAVMDFPAAWCDAFVDWCFYKAYGKGNAEAMIGGHFDDYTKNSAKLYIGKEAFFYAKTFHGKKGDQVFFSKNGTFDGIYHTGLVVDADETYIYTVEGNTSDGKEVVPNGGAVCRKKYAHTNPKLYGFGRPKYSNAEWHWVKADGVWYYQDGFGRNSYGWKVIKESGSEKKHWYYFNQKGQMLKDLQAIDGELFYLQNDGALEGACCKTDERGALKICDV